MDWFLAAAGISLGATARFCFRPWPSLAGTTAGLGGLLYLMWTGALWGVVIGVGIWLAASYLKPAPSLRAAAGKLDWWAAAAALTATALAWAVPH